MSIRSWILPLIFTAINLYSFSRCNLKTWGWMRQEFYSHFLLIACILYLCLRQPVMKYQVKWQSHKEKVLWMILKMSFLHQLKSFIGIVLEPTKLYHLIQWRGVKNFIPKSDFFANIIAYFLIKISHFSLLPEPHQRSNSTRNVHSLPKIANEQRS